MKMRAEDEMRLVLSECYVVITELANKFGIMGSDSIEKILDNITEGRMVHSDVIPFEVPTMCSCGDRDLSKCPGAWEPGCDLGNTAKYASRYEIQPVSQPTEGN